MRYLRKQCESLITLATGKSYSKYISVDLQVDSSNDGTGVQDSNSGKAMVYQLGTGMESEAGAPLTWRVS